MPCKETRRCELCSDAAALYCPSDSAFLCCRCDSAVHSANFLVARHVRSTLCCSCGDFDGDHFSGVGIRRSHRSVCRSCGGESQEEDESSLSSVCISTTESSTAGRLAKPKGKVNASVSSREDCFGEVTSERRTWRSKVDGRVEGILVNWCRRLELDLDRNKENVVVETAARVLGESLGRLTYVPVRVGLAASFWMGIRLCVGEHNAVADTCQNLKRVEKITGVPAKMILAVEAKLRRVSKIRSAMVRDDEYQEGWAEC